MWEYIALYRVAWLTCFPALQLFENMAEIVQRGIQEAQLQLQKESEKRILEEVCFFTLFSK